MKKVFHFFLLPLTLLGTCILPQTVSSQSVASRIGNSPYPVSSRPDTLCLINIQNYTPSQQFTTVTLQGILSEAKPRILVQWGNLPFQTALHTGYGITYDSTYLNDFTGLIGHFSNTISGYLLCLLNDSSANIAVTSCRFFNAIAVTPADTATMSSLGIPQIYNMIGKSQHWVFDTFQPVLSKRVISYQDTVKNAYLSDYSIFAGALQYWDTTNTAFSDTVYNNLLPNSVMEGWGPDEHSSVLQCSQHGVMVNASDWASNLSVYTNIDAALAQKNESSDTTIIPGKHTVCFVMTDGDKVQWLTGPFGTNTGWYGSPHRGQANIGWTISPALAELAPAMMKNFYDSAANTPQGQDYFIAAASGMGYYYPDAFNGLDSAAAITSRMMQKSDLHILNIIGNVFSDSLFAPYLNEPNIDAIFYYDYTNYSGLTGLASCANGKPVISARFNLWTAPYDPTIAATIINEAAKDPSSPAGYSLIDVNVWTNSVDSILITISKFDSSVRVVTPDAFVKLFRKGVSCDSLLGISAIGKLNNKTEVQLSCRPNPVNQQATVLYSLPESADAELSLYNICGQKMMALKSGLMRAGPQQTEMNVSGLAPGIYYLNLKGASFSASVKCAVVK
jgi:hypothetical protein